jgi:hypothetical protein
VAPSEGSAVDATGRDVAGGLVVSDVSGTPDVVGDVSEDAFEPSRHALAPPTSSISVAAHAMVVVVLALAAVPVGRRPIAVVLVAALLVVVRPTALRSIEVSLGGWGISSPI